MTFNHGTQWICVQKLSLAVMIAVKEGSELEKVKTRLCLYFRNCLSMILLNVFVFCYTSLYLMGQC